MPSATALPVKRRTPSTESQSAQIPPQKAPALKAPAQKAPAATLAVDETIPLPFDDLDCTLRVRMTNAEKRKRVSRSYVLIKGNYDGNTIHCQTTESFRRELRRLKFPRVFDAVEFCIRFRKKVTGTETSATNYRNQYAQTPDSLYDYMRDVLHLKLSAFDPCPPNPTFDGLAQDTRWVAGQDETLYVNPPFKESKEWIAKGLHELDRGACDQIAFLLPCRVCAPWFEMLVERCSEVLIPKRVTFKGYAEPYPWGVALYIIPKTKPHTTTTLRHLHTSFK